MHDTNDIKYTIVKSIMTKEGSAEVGVKARHLQSNITATSTFYSTQYQNKVAATKLLLKKLADSDQATNFFTRIID